MSTEMKEFWKEQRIRKKRRHISWAFRNRGILEKSGLIYEDKGETLLFREKGLPKVDFYPSTGRWKCEDAFYSGGASAFIIWYEKLA